VDLSYLDAFGSKALRETRRIMKHGTTVEDIDKYLNEDKAPALQPVIRLEKPCCGEGKIDKQVKAFREKQKKLKVERSR